MDSSHSERHANEEPYLGDLVAIDRLGTVTEARLLASALVAAGIPAVVADANLIQADVLLTTATGGVRLMVPASMALAGRDELAKVKSGAYELEGDRAVPPAAAPVATDLKLWPPDAAALWSFALTPAFGSFLHFLNGRALRNGRPPGGSAVSLALALIVSAGAIYMAAVAEWSFTVLFRAGLIASGYTALWYLFAARSQSAYVTTSFGTKYQRLPVGKLAAGVMLGALAVGGLGHVVRG